MTKKKKKKKKKKKVQKRLEPVCALLCDGSSGLSETFEYLGGFYVQFEYKYNLCKIVILSIKC